MNEMEASDEKFVLSEMGQLALSFPEILENVLKYGSVEDLKNFRLVSTQWYQSSKKIWKESAPVRLVGHRTLSTSTSKFITFLNSTAGSHNLAQVYSNFALSLKVTREEMSLFQSFLYKCRLNVSVLDLDGCSFPDVPSLQNILFKSFPNMTQLSYTRSKVQHTASRDIEEPRGWTKPQHGEHLNLRRLTFDETINYSGISWMELLSHYSNLKVLNIGIPFCYELVETIFTALKTIRHHHPNKLPLTTITTKDKKHDKQEISPARVQAFLDPKLQLENVTLNLNGNNGAALLRSIIFKHGTFLRKLELRRWDSNHLDPNECFIVLPGSGLLENLQELKLNSRIFTTLMFLRHTPNLRKLSIGNFSEADPSLIIESAKLPEMGEVRLEKCLELEMENFATVKRLQLLMTWLPNVERLKIPLDNAAFAQMCEGWPKLISLNVTPCRLDECGITGLDKDQVDIINTGQGQRSPTVPRANITCLKYLRSFSMSRNNLVDNTLRRCSVLYGFQQLSYLESVTIELLRAESDLWKKLSCSYGYTLRSLVPKVPQRRKRWVYCQSKCVWVDTMEEEG